MGCGHTSVLIPKLLNGVGIIGAKKKVNGLGPIILSMLSQRKDTENYAWEKWSQGLLGGGTQLFSPNFNTNIPLVLR